eukprot:gene2299-5288_t
MATITSSSYSQFFRCSLQPALKAMLTSGRFRERAVSKQSIIGKERRTTTSESHPLLNNKTQPNLSVSCSRHHKMHAVASRRNRSLLALARSRAETKTERANCTSQHKRLTTPTASSAPTSSIVSGRTVVAAPRATPNIRVNDKTGISQNQPQIFFEEQVGLDFLWQCTKRKERKGKERKGEERRGTNRAEAKTIEASDWRQGGKWLVGIVALAEVGR